MPTPMHKRGLFPIALVTAWALTAVPSAGAAPGDAIRGEAFFVGAAPFAEGGAPCLACHGMAGLGPAGGASYGPDLTSMFEDFGEQGVVAILESLPFPSMRPVYAERPLADGERSDLMAFLASKGPGHAPRITGALILEVAIGTASLFGLTFLFGLHRLKGVRRPLVAKPHERKR